jgi:NAD(P)-dependent dehydrogenase (short-subunit alcohol dehydrogenase family)
MSKKRILITGSTDGIGLETAKMLVSLGHEVLLHGRNAKKLEAVVESLSSEFEDADIESYTADLSVMSQVEELAEAINAKHQTLDGLINNAGVFVVPVPKTAEGLDVRFVVNVLAPYLLTKRLLPITNRDSRVINLSSAAQSRVDIDALRGQGSLADGEAYAQSKLAITMWSRHLAETIGENGPAVIAVNPGSFLGSKMVKEAYGRDGKDLGIGAEILTRAVLSPDFASATGKYFDNDSGSFAAPHPDALDPKRNARVVATLDSILGL